MTHGGAIVAFYEIVAMAAARSGAPLPPPLRGVTTSLAIEFLALARACDLLGTGRVLRRGRTLTNVEIDLHADPGTFLVAQALTT